MMHQNDNAIAGQLAIAIFLFVHCCVSVAGPITLDKYGGLASAIDRYYKTEQAKDWRTAHSLRDSKFREDIEIETYVRIQSEADQGWRLVKWSVENAYEKNGYVVVEMKFTEIAPKEFLGAPKAMTLEGKETSVWMKEADRWYCVECAIRGRLVLNASRRDWKNGSR